MIPSAQNPVSPMLAKAVAAVPDGPGLAYEPKWDGFRGLVYVDDDGGVEIGSRGSKFLTRYFPELVDAVREQVTGACVLDGEIVLRQGDEGHETLDWEALSARIHPAASRIAKLSAETPASFIAFDLLACGDLDLTGVAFSERRAALVDLSASFRAPLHLGRTTDDPELARSWLDQFEGAGLDGVVAKPLDAVYEPGKRRLLKIKHHRTADVVAVGYRVHASGSGVGSLLVALHDENGELRNVGGVSAFSNATRLALVDELAPLVLRDDDGSPVAAQGERNRFSSSKDVSFVPLEPTRVLEVRYDQMEGHRFRHTVQFERWRPDRDASSCTFEQLEVPAAYDFGAIVV
ncbi:ATP-dependent DNA ligase [Frondihabitans sp. PhB188]|uniref:ATP-dependent DNA ligase n=1 Tax=Frondihabitans sp. PhB188 TaxID=2485200 RepID=UPI000F4896AD|nr:ATP-dependent DNA ligase [Frondihabitans sp. PhB188]ROQ40769.1 ATP-dependent DNA ligase [Frondihabitans sp. PhB188]